jgi:GNAT superfamily N-acetyltransferase
MDLTPLRLATPADHDAVVALVNAAYEKYIPRIGRKPRPMEANYADLIARKVVFVLERDGVLVGVLVLWQRDHSILLDNIAVAPHAQGQGNGKLLLEWVEAFTRAHGRAQVDLYTNEKMVENIAIYTHMGYVETGRYEGDGFLRVSFCKQLAAV